MTQDSNSHVRRVRPYSGENSAPPRRKNRKPVAYVVFEGVQPGIYNTWCVICIILLLPSVTVYFHRDEVKPLVIGISHSNYKGYASHREAQRCYMLAGALGSLLVRSKNPSVPPTRARPISENVMQAFSLAADDFLGEEWYVVTKGLRPGVYPAW